MNGSSLGVRLMGTLAWGEGGTGRLCARERLALVRNLAFVQCREQVDAMCWHLGLLKPRPIKLDELAPPENALVNDALQLAEETHDTALLYHSWRTYFFGALIAAHEGIAFERSVFFAASILHDIGLTRTHEPDACHCCFALSGGQRAAAHLRNAGAFCHVAEKVGDAIALHLNAWVSRRLHGAEAHLVSRGAVCDLFGAGRRRIHPQNLDEVHATYPRDGVIEALRYGSVEHCAGTRAAVMTRLTGGKAPPDPFTPAEPTANPA